MKEGRYTNLSKFFYDIAKLSFGGFIVTSIISKETVHPILVGLGFCLTCMLVMIAFWLDEKGGK